VLGDSFICKREPLVLLDVDNGELGFEGKSIKRMRAFHAGLITGSKEGPRRRRKVDVTWPYSMLKYTYMDVDGCHGYPPFGENRAVITL
jgi:hypothetical protein